MDSRDNSSSLYYVKNKNDPNYRFNLDRLSTDESPAPHYENPPHMFHYSQKNLQRKDTIFPMIYLINTLVAALEKSE